MLSGQLQHTGPSECPEEVARKKREPGAVSGKPDESVEEGRGGVN